MAPRKTDQEKRKYIADYVAMGSYSAVAEKHGVSHHTVKAAVLADPEFARKCQDKKSADARAILAHMDTKRVKVCQIIDRYLDELLDVEQFDKLTPAQMATAMGILIDKFALEAPPASSAQEGDDPLTAALKESADAIRKAD